MTPIDLFGYAAAGVFGALSPLFILYFFKSASISIREALSFREKKYGRMMHPKQWWFRGAEQAPNPSVIIITFENSESGDKVKIGIEKKDIAGLVKNV